MDTYTTVLAVIGAATLACLMVWLVDKLDRPSK